MAARLITLSFAIVTTRVRASDRNDGGKTFVSGKYPITFSLEIFALSSPICEGAARSWHVSSCYRFYGCSRNCVHFRFSIFPRLDHLTFYVCLFFWSVNSAIISNWTDTSPTCPFECSALKSTGNFIHQIGNCGCTCTDGILPAKDGKIYPDLFIADSGYFTNCAFISDPK